MISNNKNNNNTSLISNTSNNSGGNNLIDDTQSLISNKISINNSAERNRKRLDKNTQKNLDEAIDNAYFSSKNDVINFEEVAIKRSLFFRLYINGTIEYGNFSSDAPIKAKYEFVFGKDWEKEDGNLRDETQFSCKGDGTYNYYSYNNQFEISFRSINLYGWPQIVVTCSTINSQGNEVVLGYGCVHVPMCTGRHERKIHIFSLGGESSVWHRWFGKKNEKSLEMIKNPKVISTGEGREISRAKCEGWIKVIFQVSFRDFSKFGFISK
jgi:B9 domain-containing protein 1